MNEPREFLVWWVLSLAAAATVAVGRIGYSLWRIGPDEPDDPVKLKHWRRRRRWLVLSELSALPAFATIAVAAVAHWGMSPVTGVLLAMGMGGVGFAMLLDALQYLFRKRVGLPEGEGA
ncbi:hypothetical protein SAMN02927924_01443 [Sphingobium faniae]|nr:hypothetical protein SAMN02927924_01443 [Sphingobium faniae]